MESGLTFITRMQAIADAAAVTVVTATILARRPSVLPASSANTDRDYIHGVRGAGKCLVRCPL